MGRNNGNGGRGRRRSCRSGGRGSGRGQTNTTTGIKLSAAKPELQDCVFCVNEPDQAHNFIEVKKKLITWASKHFDDRGVMMTALETETDFSESKPTAPKDAKGVTVINKATHEGHAHDQKWQKWDKKNEEYQANEINVAGVIINQCTKGIITKLEAKDNFATLEKDPILLLKAIKAMTQQSED